MSALWLMSILILFSAALVSLPTVHRLFQDDLHKPVKSSYEKKAEQPQSRVTSQAIVTSNKEHQLNNVHGKTQEAQYTTIQNAGHQVEGSKSGDGSASISNPQSPSHVVSATSPISAPLNPPTQVNPSVNGPQRAPYHGQTETVPYVTPTLSDWGQ